MTGACAVIFLLTGCHKKSNDVWDSSTTSHYKKDNSLWGGSDELSAQEKIKGPNEEEFIPLREEDLQTGFSEGAIPQPKETPGELGSSLPGADSFQNPSGNLFAIFRTLYFNTDDYVLRSKESLQALDKIAAYLKEHPKTHLFIEGHCDERGPEAYNLSLGARRANSVRALLVQRGVDLNRVHTVSYGKEKPAEIGHSSEVWAKNRRAQFKIHNQP